MKKCLLVLLAVAMLLPGCKKPTVQQPQTPEQQEAAGLYDPDHYVGHGGFRAYPLGSKNFIGIAPMGSKLFLLRDDGTGMVLQGENCQVTADGSVGFSTFSAVWDIYAQGLAVYHENTKEVVVMNPQLQEVDRIQLPQDIEGKPAISLESNQIFYCQAGEIRALDMETKVPRLMKSHIVEDQSLFGSYFDGKVLGCITWDTQGKESVLFLSTENGTTLHQDEEIHHFVTVGDRYFIRRSDNTVMQNIVGERNGDARDMQIQGDCRLDDALSMNGIVGYSMTDNGLSLTVWDITDGNATARALLPNCQEPVDIAANDQFVWMIMEEEDQQVLYRWDLTETAVDETVSVLAPLYTAQSPDTDALRECEILAEQMNENYGVDIRIWEDAATAVGDYTVETEYQSAVIQAMMTQLEPVLQQFPTDFLDQTNRSGNIRIGLVRSITGDRDWVQIWAEGDCVILISSYADAGQAFLEAVGCAIDSHVLGNSRDFDTWESLNPSGFRYGAEEQKAEHLEGENRAFVNESSMTAVTEDRRTLFVAAMAGENGDVFTSQIMQKKLRRMCEGIREAYGLEKKQEVYPWEQYLDEPMVKLEQNNG